MKTAVRLLAGEQDYDVPQQNLHIDLKRIPTLPESRFIISNVRHAVDMREHARVLRSAERRVF